VEAISSLPRPGDIDADYSPQYVRLARIVRAAIVAGGYRHGERVTAAALAGRYRVSNGVALAALAMLAANGYMGRPAEAGAYRVTWQAAQRGTGAHP
jgi:DNA-binding GntR family transcriptional regulator